MEIRVLQYFLAVAREESISKAAESLFISQPTLSRQLMDMETQLGKKLFIRGNRKITLTDEGVFLRNRAEEIVSLVEKTELEFSTPDEIISGNIHIGGGETKAMQIIARAVQKFNIDYPNVQYHLYSGNGEDVSDKLDKGLIDFGVFIDPVDISKYDYLRIPAKDEWGVLMRKDSPLAQNDTIVPSDLYSLPVILSRQSLVKSELSKWLGRDFSHINIVSTYNLVYNASLLVEQGIGYAVTLDNLINTSGNSPLCFKPLSPSLTAGLNFAWKKHQVFSRTNEKFLEYIRLEFAKLI